MEWQVGTSAGAWNSVLGGLQEAPPRDPGGQHIRKAWWRQMARVAQALDPGPVGLLEGHPRGPCLGKPVFKLDLSKRSGSSGQPLDWGYQVKAGSTVCLTGWGGERSMPESVLEPLNSHRCGQEPELGWICR